MATMAVVNKIQGYSRLRLLLQGSLTRCTCVHISQSTAPSESSLAHDNHPSEVSEKQEIAPEETVRNVSGLEPNQRRQYHGLAPILPYKNLRQKRTIFAKFGMKSEEDPRLMWPSRSEILAAEEEERDEGLGSLQERLKSIQDEKKANQMAIIKRRRLIEQNMEMMPKWIAEYNNRLKKEQDTVNERLEQRNVLLEEAREYFGYKIAAHDPKFEQMLEDRKENFKKAERQRKKEEKAKKAKQRLIDEAKLVGMDIEKDTVKE